MTYNNDEFNDVDSVMQRSRKIIENIKNKYKKNKVEGGTETNTNKPEEKQPNQNKNVNKNPKHKEKKGEVKHTPIFPKAQNKGVKKPLIKSEEAVVKGNKPKNVKPAPHKGKKGQGGFKITHGSSYIYRRRFKNPKKFPFVKPQNAYLSSYPVIKDKADKKAPKDTLRVIAFGGLEQVGINCMGFEYNNEVVIVDMGLQFPDQYSNGISFRVPDLSYLNGKKVVGICITHGHIDHIWGVPHLIKQFGKGVPIYATPMALELIKLKQDSFNYQPILVEYNRDKGVNVGQHFNVVPFVVDHSIPDSIGLMLNTPAWRIVHTGDWKFDNNPPEFRPSTNYKTLESFGKMGVKMLLSDSTNAFMTGSSISEKEIVRPLEEIFEGANGRVITATFSSIIDRIALIISISEKMGRKVVLLGRGMNDYMTIAKKLGYVRHKPDTLISAEEAEKLPDDQVTVCCTGAQGERYAALMRIAIGENRDVAFKKGDTVIFSSSVIPGNERSVQELFGLCLEHGVDIHHYRTTNVHAGGHARQEDVKHMLDLIKPENFMPIYGERYMLHENAKIALNEGIKKENIFVCRNGEVLEIQKEEGKVNRAGFVRSNYISVDGGLVWMTWEREIHEREQLKDSGTVIVVVSKSSKGYNVKVESLGLPSLTYNLSHLRRKIQDTVNEEMIKNPNFINDVEKNKRKLEKKVGNMIFQEIEKEPVVKTIFTFGK